MKMLGSGILSALLGQAVFCQITQAVPSTANQPTSTREAGVITTKDIFEGSVVSADQLDLRNVDRSRLPPGSVPLRSLSRAVGRVAVHGISSGVVLCESDLRLPNRPGRTDRWLFDFQKSELSKHVGEKISLKGHWLKGLKEGYGILDYSGKGRVYIELSDANGPQAKELSQLYENQCVMASGILRRSKVGHIDADRYFLDDHGIVVRASQW